MAANTAGQANHLLSDQSQPGISSRRILRWTPSVLWILAAVLLTASILFPYWGMTLYAPQYPGGLSVRVFVNSMTGDEDPVMDEVREIDGLNHYIGMRPLGEAAKFERSIAIPAVIIFAVFLLVAALWRQKWSWLLAIPPLAFPVVFLADLAYWLNNFGQNLDPAAPLSSAIHPFTPPVLGEGVVGQFRTVAHVDVGWFLAAGAAVLILVALVIHFWLARRAAVDELSHA